MNVSFLDFWQYPKALNPNNNFFIHVIRQVFENVQIVHPNKADVIFFSCFGNENELYKDCKRVFYTGENKRPNFQKCDYSLTFDYDTYGGKNFRLPLWYLYIDWFNVKTYNNPDWLIPESYLYEKSEFTQKRKNKFCSIVFGSPVESRIKAIENISKYKPVDVFGKINPNHHLPEGEKHKLDLISNYKFSLCYENSIHPGYHTEKLLHGKIAGNIPIYYGANTVSKDFNEECFIAANNLSLEELNEKIEKIDNDNKLYQKILNQPLFTEKKNLDSIKEYFYCILK